MKGEKKNTFYLALFGIIFVAFIALRIIQFMQTKQDNGKNNNSNIAIANQTTQSMDWTVSLIVRAAYSNTSIVIDQSGKLTYHEVLLGMQARPDEEIVIEQTKLNNIMNQVDQLNFFSWEPAYRAASDADTTISTISLTKGQASHSVLCQSDCPGSFYQLAEAIKALWPQEFKILEK